MTLQFTLKNIYGKDLYYPASASSQAIVDITGRKCLKLTELERLHSVGFRITIQHAVPNGMSVNVWEPRKVGI